MFKTLHWTLNFDSLHAEWNEIKIRGIVDAWERKKNTSGVSQNRDSCLSRSGIMILPNNEEDDLEVNIWIPLFFLVYSKIANFLTNLLKPTSQPTPGINLHSHFFYKAHVCCSKHVECFSSKDQIKIIATQTETHSRYSQIYQG